MLRVCGLWCVACGVSIAVGAWLGTGPARSPRMTILSNTNSATVMEVRVPGIDIQSVETKWSSDRVDKWPSDSTGSLDHLTTGSQYDLISLPGQTMAALDIGKPQLPKLSYLLAIPDQARVTVTVTVLESETLDNIKCYPLQELVKDGPSSPRPSSGTPSSTEDQGLRTRDQTTLVVDSAFYAQNTVYPEPDARVLSIGRWRGLPVANIEVFPVKYNPGLRRLFIARRLRVEVNYSGGSYVPRTIEPWLARVYRSSIDNLSRLKLGVAWSDSPGVRYLVVNCAKYSGSWLDSLVAWHRQQGIQTRVVTRDSWPSDQSVWDTIAREYYSHDPPLLRWVLLVGNQYEVPMHYFHSPIEDVPLSDYWYALMDTASVYPDVGIGRLYAGGPGDLTGQVRKILKYEKNPDCSTNWMTRVTLIAHNQLYPDEYSACIRGIYSYPYAYYHYTFDTIQGGDGGTNAMISADLNQGRGIVNYRGEGLPNAWWDWNPGWESWMPGNIDALQNGDMTPVVTNFCCSTHNLATMDCLGVCWMTQYPGGAVASLGASTNSFTAPNSARDSMFFRSLADTALVQVNEGREYSCPTFDLGWVLNTADAYMLKNYNPDSTGSKENAEMFFLLGDPALAVWSGGTPLVADLDFPDGIPPGPCSLTVRVTMGGQPVQAALVCASKDTDFYATDHTDGNGRVTLAVNPRTRGCFPIFASGGHLAGPGPTPMLPAEGFCTVHSAYYVTQLRHRIDDAPPGGNGDGIVNPTETVHLPLWVVNRGSMAGRSVEAWLRTGDPAVTITDSVCPLGAIPVGDSAFTGGDGFTFRVGDTCSNGHVIVFNLTTRDTTNRECGMSDLGSRTSNILDSRFQMRDSSDSSWTSSFPVVVGTAVAGYAGQIIDKTKWSSSPVTQWSSDTWSPGHLAARPLSDTELDPGETAQLYVALHNSGLGPGHQVTARLHSGNPHLLVRDSTVAYGTILRDSTEFPSTGFTVRADSGVLPGQPVACTLLVSGDDALHSDVPFAIVVGRAQAFDPIHDNVSPAPIYWAIDDSDLRCPGRPIFNWIEARGRGQELYLGLNQTVPVALPSAFGPFKFYNQRDTLISVCGNGWLAPDWATAATTLNAPLPTTKLTASVCADWCALSPSLCHGVWVFYDTAAHAFVVEWDSVAYADSLHQADKFEVVIFDTARAGPDGMNPILVQYLTANRYHRCTAGIQDWTQTCGINCLCDGVYNAGTVAFHPGGAVLYTTDMSQLASAVGAGSRACPALRGQPLAAGSPFRGAGPVYFTLPQATTVHLLVYDASGRRVKTLLDGGSTPVQPGAHKLRWDGRSESGAIAPEGVYFYRLETGLGTTTCKAIKLL